MRLETGIYKGRRPWHVDGWRILCEQEKTPCRMTDAPDCPVLVFEGETPDWLGTYMEAGGVAVVSSAEPEGLPFQTDPIGTASLEYVDLTALDSGRSRIQSLVQVYGGEGLGLLALHEQRNIKLGMRPDEYSAVLWQSVGRGGCWYTGIPLSALITALGDTLRPTDGETGFSERVTAVDKHLLLRAMAFLLRAAFFRRGLPYVSLGYYPGDYRSAFAFRVDVDGIYGKNLGLISSAAEECGIPVTFYVNQKMCEGEKERLFKLSPMHDVGCHAVLHNLYTGEEENYRNVHDCRAWMDALGLDNGPWFVAPRGMWNYALNRALDREGVSYSSDFGYCIHGLPFYPYDHGTRMAVKQIPVDPFSAERAHVQAEEEGRTIPDADDVAAYFCRSAREQYDLGLPVILYSHPQYFGPLAARVLPRLKETLDGLNIWQTTLKDFDAWWSLRDGVDYRADYDGATGDVTIAGVLPQGVNARILREEAKAYAQR